MIDVRCTNCGQTAQIDDAFAGGVCRCRKCGAIQTVPRSARRTKAGTVRQARPETVRSQPAGGPERVGVFRWIPTSSPSIQLETHRRLMLAVGTAALLSLVGAGVAIAIVGG